jgi:major membrane immunogen (membrane-anchored lipoprotein)
MKKAHHIQGAFLMTKRTASIVLILAAALFSISCSTSKLKDGVYFAQDKDFAPQGGWKEQVVVTVSRGTITAVNWNGVSNLGVADKKTVAASGGYGMVKASKLGIEWDKQAANVEAFLLKTRDTAFSKFKDDGTTDAITGASIHAKNFFALVNQALAAGPASKGIYKKDGWFFAAQPDFDAKTGWKDSVLLTVVNGTLVDAVWNATNKDPAKIPLKADGTSDAVSGASLHLTAVPLAVAALAAAR